jgi:hypothetical protein
MKQRSKAMRTDPKPVTRPAPAPDDPTGFVPDDKHDPKLHPDFVNGYVPTTGFLRDSGLCVTLPRRRVPVLARPGMCVVLNNNDSNRGVILNVLPDFCIVRSERGDVYALCWGEVELADVRPDPDYIPVKGVANNNSTAARAA